MSILSGKVMRKLRDGEARGVGKCMRRRKRLVDEQ